MSSTKKSNRWKWTSKRDKMSQNVITFERFSQALLKKELAKIQPVEPEDDIPGPIVA